MTSAIDSNVLIALLAGDEQESDAARLALIEAAASGSLLICPAVYSELMAMPGLSVEELDLFLEETAIEVDWMMEREVWTRAGSAFSAYADRRRSQKGDLGPRRILADFLIGAHALNEAAKLLTLDPQLYKANFRELDIVVPTAAQ